MKKITKIFILLAILGLSISSAFAQGGSTGPLTWELNGNTLTISGNGAMPDYDPYEGNPQPWSAYSYEGAAYSTYNIYRASGDTPGEFQLIGTMPGGNTSFSDFGAPAGYVYYIVEIVLNETCNVGKAGSSIKSNMASNNPGVGIDDLRFAGLRIYPNPTTGQLIIDNGQLTIDNVEVFDVYGRKLLSFVSLISPETTIDISHLSAGVYFVKIRTEAGEAVRKVLKE